MKRTLILAAVAASLAAPVVAQSAQDFAFAHFNESVDSTSDLRQAPVVDNTTTVSTRSNSAIGFAIEHFNASVDSKNDLRGTEGVTLVNGTPAYGADIFAALRAESLENE